MANESVKQLNDALDKIDEQTTRIGTGITGVGVRIDNLMNQILLLPTTAEVNDIVLKAKAEVDKLAPLADSLTAMAVDPSNPVPVPVPVPEPVPAPTPEPTPIVG